jgi:GPH family glycoside/pentoside/hexuronide:cation symporter
VSTTSTPAEDRLPLGNIVAFSALGMPATALLLTQGLFLTAFLASTTTLGLAVGIAFTIVRFIDVFVDPFLGMAMDQTRTPIGRYRPWILASIPFIVIGIWRLFMPSQGITQVYLIFWLLVLAIGNSMFSLGQAAWAANLVTGYTSRARLYGWMQGIGVTASVVILLLPFATRGGITLSNAHGLGIVGVALMILFPVIFIAGSFLTPDRSAPQQSVAKAKFKFADYLKAIGRPDMFRVVLADLVLTLGPGMTGPLYVFFFAEAKHFSFVWVAFLLVPYIGAGVLGSPFWALVAQRVGKHRMIQIACVAYAITQTALMAIPAGQVPLTCLGMFGVGFCVSAFLIGVRAMVADLCDVVRLEQGQDQTTLLYSMVTTTTKIGGSITTGIAYGILALVGFNPAHGAHNTPGAIQGLVLVYVLVPIILVWLGGAMLFGYKLDAKKHAEVRDALAARELAASEESLLGEHLADGELRPTA